MRMDAMYKAADRQEAVDTGKCLNLLDFQLYAWNEQEQWALILARNFEQGNQWLEDDNFYPPETAAHKFVESDDETSPEEISTSLTIPNAKNKNQQHTTSCNIPNESASVMSNVKGRGQGVGRGRGQQKQNATVRGRGARCAIGGQGQGQSNYNNRENNTNDSNDGNYGPMVRMDVEDAYLKNTGAHCCYVP